MAAHDVLGEHSRDRASEEAPPGSPTTASQIVAHRTLNPAEMEASLVSRECLGSRRSGHLHTLKAQVAAWRQRTDSDRRPIRWKVTAKDARRVFRYDGVVTPRTEQLALS